MKIYGIRAFISEMALAFFQFNALNFGLLKNIILAIVLGAIAAVLSFRLKFLTKGGSWAAFLLAVPIFGLGGWKWGFPLIYFFLSSSILSKVRKKYNYGVENYFEKTGVRDHFQVISNGGLGGILVIMDFFFPSSLYYLFYTGMLAAVCADTWGTEIGTLVRAKTYNVLNLRAVEQGTSGGVSVLGTLAGALGALTVALSSAAVSSAEWVNNGFILYFCIIVFSGIMGSFLDSFLGASLQAGFSCTVCGKMTEKEFHCGCKTVRTKGFAWINNDTVNLTAGLSGGIFAIIFRNILL